MKNLRILLSLHTRDNDFQIAQAAAADQVSRKLGIQLKIAYADNDAVNQSTEILGAMWYAGFGDVVIKPGIRIVDSAVTLVGHRQHSFGKGRWKNWIEVERKGEKFLWTDWAIDFISTATQADIDAVKKLGKP